VTRLNRSGVEPLARAGQVTRLKSCRRRGYRPDYTVVTGEWEVGRIYQTRGGPNSLRWFWSMTVNGPMTCADRVATLEEAKAQFQKSWDEWKAWAKLEEAP
jgi:hypothetical protein